MAADKSGSTARTLDAVLNVIQAGKADPFIKVAATVKVSSQEPLHDLISGSAVFEAAIIVAIGAVKFVTVVDAATATD